MATLVGLATAVPPHLVTADVVLAHADRFADVASPEAFARLVRHTRVEQRHMSRPPEDLLRPRTVDVTAAWHHEAALALARDAIRGALAEARVAPRDVDALVVATATGYEIPALDAYLVDELGLPATTRRYPFTTFGCAGGVAALTRGAELADAGRTVVFVAVETPSLTLRVADRSKTSLVAVLLFGDGAGAGVLVPTPRSGKLRVRAARSLHHRGTYDAMGFRVQPDGFRLLLGTEVPTLAAAGLADEVGALARAAGATASDLRFVALHPGGPRVLEEIEVALRLPRERTQRAWDVLRTHGNMSSATVLFVLAEELARRPAPGALGLVAAFGPGFGAELALVEVTP